MALTRFAFEGGLRTAALEADVNLCFSAASETRPTQLTGPAICGLLAEPSRPKINSYQGASRQTVLQRVAQPDSDAATG